MDSCVWMDRGYQQVQSPLQSSEPAVWQSERIRTVTFGTSYQYRMSNTGAHPPQSYQSCQSLSPDWQAGTASYRQAPAEGHNSNYWRINGNYQSGNPQFMAGNGAQQGFSPNCPQNSSAQGPPNISHVREIPLRPMYTAAAYTFHHMEWSPSDKQSFRTQNLNHRTNSTHDRLPASGSPPGYFSAGHQTYRNITANSSSSQQAVIRRQSAQPHQALVNPRRWCKTSSCSTTDRPPLNSSDETRDKVIARIVEDLRNSFTSSPSAAKCGNQYVSQSQVTGSEFSHHKQQAGNDSYNPQPEITHSQAAKQSNTTENVGDLYRGPVQPSSDASQSCMSTTLIRTLLTGSSNGGSAHLSPGCVGTRAVAVVQPLLQDCHQGARHSTSPDMIDKPTKHAQMDKPLGRKKQKVQKRAPVIREKSMQTSSVESQTSNSSASDDALLDSSAALTQNQPTESEPEPASDIQAHQHGSPAAQEPAAEVPESRSRDKDDSVNPTDAPESFVELSSIPTIPHTYDMLKNIIHELNTESMDQIRKSSSCSSAEVLINMFWDGDAKAAVNCVIESLRKAYAFCREHLTEDTVIMSVVKEDDWKAVKGHRILKHDEVYIEPPYQPFWLNEDEKLDAIEKEFGLPWHLRRNPRPLEADIDLDQEDSISEEILREVSETVLALREQEQVHLDGGKSSCSDETTSMKAAASTESSYPCSAFEITVLPHEEALRIFEQAAMGTKAQPEREERRSAEELQEKGDVEEEGAAVSAVEQASCLEKPELQHINGPHTALETDPPEDSETCEGEGELHVISSDCTPDPMEEWDGCSTQTIICVETVDSLENGDMGSFEEVFNSCRPSHTLINEDMDSCLLDCENRVPEQVPADALGKSTGPVQSSQEETRDLSPAMADGEHRSETETREPQVEIPSSPQAVKGNQEGLQGDDESLNRSVKPFVQYDLSETKKSSADVMESKSPPLKCGTAKLALFGSSKHPTVGKRSHGFTSGNRPSIICGPPEVLSVSLSPLKRKISEVVPSEELSVKHRIYEKWRKSFPPAQNRYKKLKSRKFVSSSAVNPKKSDKTGSLKPLPLSEKRIYDVKVITEKGRLHSNRQKPRKEKRGRGRVAGKPRDQPHEENIILKFSVLPETFTFTEDEPNSTESTIAPDQDTTDHAKTKNSDKTDCSKKGTWSEHSEKKYHPLKRKTSNLFQEFKKKYKKLLQQDQQMTEDKQTENISP